MDILNNAASDSVELHFLLVLRFKIYILKLFPKYSSTRRSGLIPVFITNSFFPQTFLLKTELKESQTDSHPSLVFQQLPANRDMSRIIIKNMYFTLYQYIFFIFCNKKYNVNVGIELFQTHR